MQCNILVKRSQSTSRTTRRTAVCYALPVTMKVNRRAPLRIVSLAPSATSILCAIGRSAPWPAYQWCADVAPVGKLPKVGDCWHMESVDQILRLKPTLVIGSVPYKQETVAKFLEQPFPFLAMNPRTLADIEADIRLLAGLRKKRAPPSKWYKRCAAHFRNREKLAAIQAAGARLLRSVAESANLFSALVAELANICGGEIAVPAGEKITEAQVAAARPEVIVLAWRQRDLKQTRSRRIKSRRGKMCWQFETETFT